MSRVLDDKSNYDPRWDYYFVSYNVISTPQWVRSPFNTLGEVKDILENLDYLWDQNEDFTRTRENYKFPRMTANYKNLRIYSESYLSELYQSYDEKQDKLILSTITNRQHLFGDRYEGFAEEVTGSSLGIRENESIKDWEKRIEKANKIAQDKNLERMFYNDKLVEQQSEIRERLNLDPIKEEV